MFVFAPNTVTYSINRQMEACEELEHIHNENQQFSGYYRRMTYKVSLDLLQC